MYVYGNTVRYLILENYVCWRHKSSYPEVFCEKINLKDTLNIRKYVLGLDLYQKL